MESCAQGKVLPLERSMSTDRDKQEYIVYEKVLLSIKATECRQKNGGMRDPL